MGQHMSDTDRDERDPREPGDARDERDEREPGDVRDERDTREPGHEQNGDTALSFLNQHPMVIGAIVSALIAGAGWFRLNQIVEQQEQDRQERVVSGIVACEERNAAWNRVIDLVVGAQDLSDLTIEERRIAEERLVQLRALGVVDCPDPP